MHVCDFRGIKEDILTVFTDLGQVGLRIDDGEQVGLV